MKPIAGLVIPAWAAVFGLLVAGTTADSTHHRTVQVDQLVPTSVFPPSSATTAPPTTTAPEPVTPSTVTLPPGQPVHATGTPPTTGATVPAASQAVWVVMPSGDCLTVDAADIPPGARQVPACEPKDYGTGGQQGLGPGGQPVGTDQTVWVEYPDGTCGQTGAAEARESGLRVVSSCPGGGQ